MEMNDAQFIYNSESRLCLYVLKVAVILTVPVISVI